MATFLSVPPFEVQQVFQSMIEIGFLVLLGLPTLFRHYLQMLPQNLGVVVPLLIMMHPVWIYNMKI